MASATQQIAQKAHEAQREYLKSLKPEERRKLELAERLGKGNGRLVPIPESRAAQMLSSGQKERAIF